MMSISPWLFFQRAPCNWPPQETPAWLSETVFLARKSSLLLNVFAFALGLNTDLFEKAARPKEKQTALLAGETLSY